MNIVINNWKPLEAQKPDLSAYYQAWDDIARGLADYRAKAYAEGTDEGSNE